MTVHHSTPTPTIFSRQFLPTGKFHYIVPSCTACTHKPLLSLSTVSPLSVLVHDTTMNFRNEMSNLVSLLLFPPICRYTLKGPADRRIFRKIRKRPSHHLLHRCRLNACSCNLAHRSVRTGVPDRVLGRHRALRLFYARHTFSTFLPWRNIRQGTRHGHCRLLTRRHTGPGRGGR